MSFSSEVKEELSRHLGKSRHCQIAELAALIAFDGKVQVSESGCDLFLDSENELLNTKYELLLKKLFDFSEEKREKSGREQKKIYETVKMWIQTSETFLLSAILALSGGFQDAYTYNVRNEVFSNAQTGNVVLMSQYLMMGEWMKGLSYLFPILSFAFGVLVAERIGHRYKKAKRIHWRQIVVAIEIIILFVVGFIPHRYDMIATMLVSFSCSMQVQSFRKVNGYGYASTMCIGNLRSGTESLSIYLRDRNIGALKKTAHYYGIILIFAIGAGIGGVCSLHIGIRAIWGSSVLLAIVCAMMVREHR